MEQVGKPLVKKYDSKSTSTDSKSQGCHIHISFVSEKERESYRVPTYGYLLP